MSNALASSASRSSLPVRPQPFPLEAAHGYLSRVAVANGFQNHRQLSHALAAHGEPADLLGLSEKAWSRLLGPLPKGWGKVGNLGGLDVSGYTQALRWCGACLDESRYFRGVWSIKLYCVCPRHHAFLRDRCPTCGCPQRYPENASWRCTCGSRLDADDDVIVPPPTLVRLTSALEAAVLGQPPLDDLPSLAPAAWWRLIRFLGAFAGTERPAKPGKTAITHHLDRACRLVTFVAYLVDQWPNRFHELLTAIQQSASHTFSVRRTFDPMYRILYVHLREPEFQFLRDAFESYLKLHWWGLLCRRNRALSLSTIATHPRRTVSEAAKQFGVCPSRLTRAVQLELIPHSTAMLPSGRRQISISEQDAPRVVSLGDSLTLREAAIRLHVAESRVRELIAANVIRALYSRPECKAAAWPLSSFDVDALEQISGTRLDGRPTIPIFRVLKCWRLRGGEFAGLVVAIKAHEVRAVGVEPVPLGKLVLSADAVRRWLSQYRSTRCDDMSIEEAAKCLRVKQQVAYDLANSGLLKTLKAGRYRRVARSAVTAFLEDYVSLSELSSRFGQSPRQFLKSASEMPVTGPLIDGTRQYFFRRAEVALR